MTRKRLKKGEPVCGNTGKPAKNGLIRVFITQNYPYNQ